LRQFVDAELPQDRSESRYTRVGLQLKVLVKGVSQHRIAFQHLVGVAPHGAKLESIKLATRPNASAPKKYRLSIYQQNQQDNEKEERRKQYD
jgi:hypothetical protein